MISIIICSRYSSLSDNLQANIFATIGDCKYEIIHIDNSENSYNIFEAYNLGVRKSHGDILCFMHEDIIFHSADWGRKVAWYLSDDDCGAIGVAGGYAILQQSDWRLYGKWIVNLIQGYHTIEQDSKYYVSYPKIKVKQPVEVATLDGVWLCARKEMFDKISFDESTYDGFHMYDTDICMQIHNIGKKVLVCDDILLEHISEGSYSPSFEKSLDAFHNKWKDFFPIVKTISLDPWQTKELYQRGEENLKEQIELESIKGELKELFAEKERGHSVRPFTNVEKKIMGKSKYAYCKAVIRDPGKSFGEVCRNIRPYLRDDCCPHKIKIVLKLMTYRLRMMLK
ncbi:MAG: glycosyltransferase family protein [Bacteroidales bacterium]|nr:glycosyltransferase family protein [Bacteroidales bacterium]MCM1147064.1 glycosyltransferase family protein [Bacteroidales bacterium]MCM1205803.1 glycosyltransferase family protein [Bacillota bacterium]MCM1509954.1 glycosyltransferase family protein [Clostridium sp.]